MAARSHHHRCGASPCVTPGPSRRAAPAACWARRCAGVVCVAALMASITPDAVRPAMHVGVVLAASERQHTAGGNGDGAEQHAPAVVIADAAPHVQDSSFALTAAAAPDEGTSGGSNTTTVIDFNLACAHNRCADCVSSPGCGWCPTTSTCMHGTAAGAAHFGTGIWSTSFCPLKERAVFGAWTYAGADPRKANISDVCRSDKKNAVAHPEYPRLPLQYDIVCKNGGMRMWDHKAWAGNSYCVCTDGWTGIDCSSCTRTTACNGWQDSTRNVTCAKGLLPRPAAKAAADADDSGDAGVHPLVREETDTDRLAKQYSCACVGPAAGLCNFFTPELPNSLRVEVVYNATGATAVVRLLTPTKLSIPKQLTSGISFWGNLSNCVVTAQLDGGCPKGTQYQWHGDAPCMKLQCGVERLFAPAPTGKDCRDQTVVDPSSWRYRGCPSFIDGIHSVSLTCQYPENATDPGSYACAFDTQGFGPLALSCDTGTCTDTTVPPSPPPPVPPPSGLSRDAQFALILGVPGTIGFLYFLTCGVVLARRNRELDAFSKAGVGGRGGGGGDDAGGGRGASVAVSRGSRGGETGDGRHGSDGDASTPLLNPTHDGNSGADDAVDDARERLSFGSDDASSTRGAVGGGGGGSGGAAAAPADVRLSFHDLTYTVLKPRRRPVLRGVSGAVSGAMFAIMGPSGAGKTTLLDLLGGRKSSTGGEFGGTVCLNDVELTAAQLRKVTGYVLQDDVMMGTQTVREYLLFQARLRLGPQVSPAQRARRVTEVLATLDLSHVADTPIGGEFVRGISGGEKRRVSIAAELITDSRVLLLDEPTSGLDSASAKRVIDTLSRVARSGRVVVLSIHQPRSYIYEQFDSVLLLAKAGELLYCGPRSGLLPHLTGLGHTCPRAFNPADFLLDIVTDADEDETARLAAACPPSLGSPGRGSRLPSTGDAGGASVSGAGAAASPARMGVSLSDGTTAASAGAGGPQSSPHDVVARYYRDMAPFGTQLWELSLRTSMNVVRNPMLLLLNYVATISVAVGVAVVFHHLPFDFYGLQDRLGFMFFSFLFFSLASLSSLGVWREERLLFLRERAMGCYSSTAYFVAKVTCELLPLRVLPPVIYSAIVYWQIGLQDEPLEAGRFIAVMVLVNLIAATVCLCVGAAIASQALANLVASFLLLFQLLLCGLLSHNVQAPWSAMWLLQHLSPLNYAFEILANNEFVGQTYNLSPKLPGHQVPPTFPATGATIISTFGLSLDHMTVDMAMLCVFFVVLLAAVHAVLALLVKEQR